MRHNNGMQMAERTVLIVEDADTCAATLEMAFSAIPGLAVVLASTAQQALRILEQENGRVCAVVTDLNLPRFNGFQLIESIRSGRAGDLPIIVVSGDTDPSTPARVARLGADAFFAKPYSPAQVRHKLEQLLDATYSRPT